MSNYSAIDMTTAAAQGFRDGVASVANSAIPNNQGASAAQPASVVPEGYLPPQCTDKSKHVKYRAGWNDALVAVSRLRMTQKPSLSCPDGYALVPIEPTPEMVNAALEYSTGIDPRSIVIEDYKAMLAAAPAQGQQVECHPDDAAVDRFAEAMKAKLAKSREKGRHGWQNCTAPHLSAMLYDHLYKADPLDVGNFAMMLHQNGQAIELPFEARGKRVAPQPAPSQDVAGLLEWAVDRWHAEVANRPLQNVHRRALDDTWRQVIRRLGGDTGLLCGPAHDALAAHDKQSGGE